jgi:hypothetical protein
MNYVEFLTDLGLCDVEDCGETLSFSTWDGMSYIVDKSAVSPKDDSGLIIQKSQWFSPCCGALLDQDYMMCPECGEHC